MKQPVILVSPGAILDAGCGTGENALFLANQGYEVTGIDTAGAAIWKAKEKSRERRVPAVYLEWDALQISGLGKRFDTVIDCGLFHVFSDEERPLYLYVEGLSLVLVPGGTFRMLCFSGMESGDWGPRRVTQNEIHEAFSDGVFAIAITLLAQVFQLELPHPVLTNGRADNHRSPYSL